MRLLWEKAQRFGILILRALRPNARGRQTQRLGALALGVALLGATQAHALKQTLLGVTQKDAAEQGVRRQGATQALAGPGAALTPGPAGAAAQGEAEASAERVGAPNIVDLIGESELILRGLVSKVADGIENGVPYTEVTVQVSEAVRGQVGEEYTFRQFGLKEPRKMGNGKVNLNVSPAGWAKYAEDEEVVLFLYKRAAWTGLRTTVGLGQGKFGVRAGNVESQFNNAGLFEGVAVDNNLLDDRDHRMLGTKKGPVNKESFMSFVRRAVNGKWIEKGKMRHAKK